jgi:preprotein translocase subunit SecF
LFGGQAIHSFTATMMFGVVLVGTYTSVFIASPILIYLGVGSSRMGGAEEPESPPTTPTATPVLPRSPTPQRARGRR